MDHTAFVARARRAFEPPMTDEQGMVPYVANPVTSEVLDTARGTGNSWILMFAHDLWPGRFGLSALVVLSATFCFSAARRGVDPRARNGHSGRCKPAGAGRICVDKGGGP